VKGGIDAAASTRLGPMWCIGLIALDIVAIAKFAKPNDDPSFAEGEKGSRGDKDVEAARTSRRREAYARGRELMLAEAIVHPVRGKILAAIPTRGEGLTIGEIAGKIDLPRRKVRYHIDQMIDDGLVLIGREARRRGVIERSFRARQVPIISTDQFLSLPPGLARAIALAPIRLATADVARAVAQGTAWNGSDHFEARVAREVDREGLTDLLGLYERTLDEVEGVLAATTERLRTSGEPGVPMVGALLLFEAAS
jgi:DNA-binding transcriptional ArsR family regulator